jgi:hypothetical protein
VLDSDDQRDIVIEAEENRDLTATDLARDKWIDKKGVSADAIYRVFK